MVRKKWVWEYQLCTPIKSFNSFCHENCFVVLSVKLVVRQIQKYTAVFAKPFPSSSFSTALLHGFGQGANAINLNVYNIGPYASPAQFGRTSKVWNRPLWVSGELSGKKIAAKLARFLTEEEFFVRAKTAQLAEGLPRERKQGRTCISGRSLKVKNVVSFFCRHPNCRPSTCRHYVLAPNRTYLHT
jgi:hypothetical protein